MIVWGGWMIAEAGRMGWISWPIVGPDMTDHLGAEYDNIAQAIHRGDGFADPFGRGDGPTAWMPPLVPYLLASLYGLTGDNRSIVIIVVQVAQLASLWLSLSLVLQPFAHSANRRRVISITATACLIHFGFLFQFAHDHIVLMPLATIIWWWCVRAGDGLKPWRTEVTGGVLGGVTALASPVLGAVWAFLTWWRIGWRWQLCVAAGVSIAIVAPWIIRCRLEFAHWIPIKSNSAYELWQSQIADDDGVISLKTFTTHPYNRGTADAASYTQDGERKMLAAKKREVVAAIRNDPGSWLERVGNRLIAAGLAPVTFDSRHEQRPWAILGKWAWAVVSTLCLAVSLFGPKRKERTRRLNVAIAVWLLTLFPYILVSYYQRYAMPIFPMQLFVMLAVVENVAERKAFRAESR